MTNHVVEDCCKRQRDKKKVKKSEDLMMISDNMELETPTIAAEAETIDDNATMKAFEELAKTLNITEVSNLYPLFIKSNHTKIVNYMSISDMVYEIFISVCKSDKGMDNLINNNYLDIFLLLKCILIDTSASKSIIKR